MITCPQDVDTESENNTKDLKIVVTTVWSRNNIGHLYRSKSKSKQEQKTSEEGPIQSGDELMKGDEKDGTPFANRYWNL